MKTNKIKIFFSIISFCFLVTSCNNLLSELTQQKTYIQISTNLDNTNQRTVLPDFSVVKENGYTWELYNGGILFQTWNDANGKSAYQNMCESKIEVDPGSYAFELKVLKDNFIILKSESQTVTIEQNKNNELNFVLCPPTENDANGSVNFKVTFPNEKVNIVEANLFKPGDDKKESFGNIQDVVIRQSDSSSTANITVNNVPAGSYLLKVDLCYQVAAYSRIETINTYTTIVQVASGFCSKAEVTLNSLTDYYTITYKVDDDIITTLQGGEDQTTFKKNTNVPLPIACNSTNNQISIGWFIDPDCTEPVELNSDDKFTITDNITLYTQWGNNVNTNDLSFDTIDTTNNIEGLLIKTETGLNYFRNIVNGTLTENIIVSEDVVYRRDTPYPSVNAKLCDDIALAETEWVPIGYYKNDNDNKAYNGFFDGNGKCVTNLKISNPTSSIGFFGYIETAIIKNLYVSGEIYCNSSYNIGGIVGYAKSSGQNYSSISNCINNVSIKNGNSSIEVGGILGYSNGAVDINSSVNIAEITNGYSVAGILGYGDYNVTINNCLNLGSIIMNGTYNAVAGIANLGQNDLNSVFTSINASQLTANGQNKKIYPISHSSLVLYNNYYDSTILPTVTAVTNVEEKTSSELDTLSLNGWYNGEDPDYQYPIQITIQEAFENKSSCWNSISDAVSIPKNNTTGDSTQYVSGAYYVNGNTGNDNNDGASRSTPKKNLTDVINSLKNSTANPTKTIYIDGTLTAESQGVTETSKKTLVTINDTDFGEINKISLIGINNATINAQSWGSFIETNQNFYMKMQNLSIINGWNNLSSGAALWFYGSSLELDECVIKDCVSEYNGNDGKDKPKYTGIYMSGSGAVLKMTNTTCENSVYLSNTTATIGSNCTIGTNKIEATDGFITLDVSTLILNGEDIVIYKPIYINNLNARIELGNDFEETDSKIQIKINPDLVSGFTLFETPPDNLLNLFELVDSEGFTLTEEGKIEK